MIYRYRFVWVAVVLLVTAGAVVLFAVRPGAEPADLRGQIATRMRATLEQADPGQHHHAGHDVAQAKGVICGVRVYGYEPAEVTELAEVRTVFGFHFCGVAEQARPWDVAVKLAGPVILDLAQEPPGIRVVEATADVKFVDRLREMFPPEYAELALKETLTDREMTDLRRRYDDAAGL
jgi:hypothetical protein